MAKGSKKEVPETDEEKVARWERDCGYEESYRLVDLEDEDLLLVLRVRRARREAQEQAEVDAATELLQKRGYRVEKTRPEQPSLPVVWKEDAR